jgi:uncharacterized membrane protein YeiH
MLQRVPAGFGGNALYASVAVLVASIQVLCTGLGEPVAGTVAGLMCGVLFRLAARRRDWRLPPGLDWQPRRDPGHDDGAVPRSRAAAPAQD